MHQWTDNDNIIAYYLYRFAHLRTRAIIKTIANHLGMPTNSMIIKIGNFKYLNTDGQSGMSGYSTQAEAIYKRYKNQT